MTMDAVQEKGRQTETDYLLVLTSLKFSSCESVYLVISPKSLRD